MFNPYIVGFVVGLVTVFVCLYFSLFQEVKNSKFIRKYLLLISIILISIALLLAIISPFFFTNFDIFDGEKVVKYGSVGDAIGGLMNPFIGIAAVIGTGLAFYAQYQANKQVQDQFKLQQFDNQFYEMLRLHKENVNEMEIWNEGNTKLISKGRTSFTIYKLEFEMFLRMLIESGEEFNDKNFAILYRLFFTGLYEELTNEIKNNIPKFYIRFNKSQPTCFDGFEIIHYTIDAEYAQFHKMYERLPNLGYIQFLGHYYRHLYQMVKFVVTKFTEGLLTYDISINYLKILRGQLSNDEQVMLFYNWIAGLHDRNIGFKWENDENQFFTEFLMIHNLPLGNLFEDDYIKKKIEYLRSIEVINRKGNLFEWD
ncbi:putative phage abortive infection protein [Sphingobacterium composti Ten et al. 2007 non Yoo et al. 2007]|uniref:putative phage abortive infection protein n=1 Tax=Sphingobacterium composti TaxID=363260 RepID=UPI00135C76FF|nr:putative phage abortive infection protein [Sphingobacterium composti Ten et al. 2007 non Yoo et al. 2007]